MKKSVIGFFTLGFILLVSTSEAFAWDRHKGNYTKDDYGHYTRNDNLYKDSDGDGVLNIHDRSDKNPWKS